MAMLCPHGWEWTTCLACSSITLARPALSATPPSLEEFRRNGGDPFANREGGADDDGFGATIAGCGTPGCGLWSGHQGVHLSPEAIGRDPTFLVREDGQLVHRTAAFDAEAFRALTFASEDNLSRFVAALSDDEAGAIYALLYGRGVRFDAGALGKWRRSR